MVRGKTFGGCARICLATCLLLLSCYVWGGESAKNTTLDAKNLADEPMQLSEYFSLFEDADQSLRIDDVSKPEFAARFTPSTTTGKTLGLGTSSSAWWLRLRLRNSGAQPRETFLETTVARLAADVDVYQVREDGRYEVAHTGYLHRFSERPYPHHFYVFPVALSPQAERTVYIRLVSPVAINVPARLWSEEAFYDYVRGDYAVQAIYFGMVLAMVSFNLLLFFILRDSSYLLYVVFACSAAFTIAANNGIAIQYLVGEWPIAANASTMTGMSFTLAVLLAFMRRMIASPRHIPRLDKLIQAVIVLHLGLIVGLAMDFPLFLKPAIQSDGLTAVLMMVSGVLCIFKRERGAVFFTAAFAALCLVGASSSLAVLGYLPPNIITTAGLQFGSAMEMLLLAFALADRYNVIRRERAAAQQEALRAQTEALQAEQRVVETLRSSERELEQKVRDRTAQLTATATQLRQTQAELVQAEKLASLGSLVAGVAQELNTPIGNAVTTASTLQDATRSLEAHLTSGEMRKSELSAYTQSALSMADLISRSCRRAATLIASFKQVAVDRTNERRQVFALDALVNDNIKMIHGGGRKVGVRIDTDVSANIQCDGYPGPLGQVLTGLIQNALSHAFVGREQGLVLVSARQAQGWIELRVQDDGLGIPADALPRIFDPFFTTSVGQGGSGLGLSIALNIVTGVLGGSLHAESTPGQGTCFVLRIPASASPLSANAKMDAGEGA